MIWSDETSFPMFSKPTKELVWRRKGEELKEQCIGKVVKKGGGKINAWGCFHANGLGPLVRIQGTDGKNGILNANGFSDIIQNSFLPYLHEIHHLAPERQDHSEGKRDKNIKNDISTHGEDRINVKRARLWSSNKTTTQNTEPELTKPYSTI